MCVLSLLVSAALIILIFRSDFVSDAFEYANYSAPPGPGRRIELHSLKRFWYVAYTVYGASPVYTSSVAHWRYENNRTEIAELHSPHGGPFVFLWQVQSQTAVQAITAGRAASGAWTQYLLILPVWPLVVIAGTPAVIWIFFNRRKIHRKWRQLRGLCPECGYDLRATPQRCPECGTPVAAQSIQVDQK